MIGDFEIQGELGRGGMGVVYQAFHVRLKRTVALKMLLGGDHAGENIVSRFRTEAEAVARLQHPNIVQIFEVGEVKAEGSGQSLPFFALEFVDGGSLDKKLAGTPQQPRTAARLIASLARAMHFAHERGVIHRDLKPANILLARDPGTAITENPGSFDSPAWTPKITDFGLAKQVDTVAGPTVSGDIMGTPSYMAPEQANGRIDEVGPLSDVYALAAMLYELLVGRPPFKSRSMLDTLAMVRADEPVPPSRLQRGVPRDLETICLKGLEKKPMRRYLCAAALAEDLERFLAGEPIHARPVKALERGLKWARRRPAVATLLAFIALSILVVLFGSLWFNARLQTALKATQTEWERAELAHEKAEQHRAEIQQQKEEEDRRIAALRTEGQELLLKAQAASSRGDWTEARLSSTRLLGRVGSEATLAELTEVAGRLLKDANRHLAQKEADAAARRRFEQFTRLHNDALFHGTLFTGVDLKVNLEATQTAARAALTLFEVDERGNGPPVLTAGSLAEQEKAVILEGCYELLLVLADAVAQPLPGALEEAQRRQAQQALAILDRANRLHRADEAQPTTKTYHLRRSRYLAMAGNRPAAAEELKRAAAIKPTTALDHFLLGDDYYKRGALTDALNAFESALRVQPEHFWAHYFTAVSYLKLKRPAEARAALSACLSRRPRFIWIYLLRGVAHCQLGAFAASEADFAMAEELDEQEFGLFVNRSVLRVEQGKLDEAAADLHRAIALKPAQYQPYDNLAQVLQKQNRFAEALAQFDKAIRLEPRLAALYRRRALLQLERTNFRHLLRGIAAVGAATMVPWSSLVPGEDDLPAALADFNQAYQLESVDSLLRAEDSANQGRIHHRWKRYGDALKAYDEALALHPLPVAHRLRAEVLLELQRYEEAIAAFDRYLATGDPVADVYRARGLARAKLGRYEAAVEDYTRALELEPNSSNMRNRRGWAYLLNSQQLALRDFDAAVRLNPRNGDAYNGRAYARVLLGHYSAAVADAEEALRQGPKTWEMHYNAACVLAQAVAKVSADTKQPHRQKLADDYRVRCFQLLDQSLELRDASERPAFWQNGVERDSALDPVRSAAEWPQLKSKHGNIQK